jgi:hypothetical protein
VDVYRCELHRLCTLTDEQRKKIGDADARASVTSCQRCPDFSEPIKMISSGV